MRVRDRNALQRLIEREEVRDERGREEGGAVPDVTAGVGLDEDCCVSVGCLLAGSGVAWE